MAKAGAGSFCIIAFLSSNDTHLTRKNCENLQADDMYRKYGTMVRIFCLLMFLSGCASHKVVYGKEAEAPWGWKYTYCPTHKDEIGCENF